MGDPTNILTRIVCELSGKHHSIEYVLDASGDVIKVTLEGRFKPIYSEGYGRLKRPASLECKTAPDSCKFLLFSGPTPVGTSCVNDLVHTGESTWNDEERQMSLPSNLNAGTNA